MKKGRKDTPYPPTPDLIKGIFGNSNEKEVEDDASASKKLKSADVRNNLLKYASESACSAAATPAPATPLSAWSVAATSAPATPLSAWSVAETSASTSKLEAEEEDAEARAFLGKGYEDIREKMAAKAEENDRLVSSPAIPNPNKQNTPLFCMVYIGEDSMGPTHILFSKSQAWHSRSLFGEQINYVSEGYHPAASVQFDQESKLWCVMGSDKDGYRCITIVSVYDMPGDSLIGKLYILCSNLIAFNLYYYIEKIRVWKNFVNHFNKRPAAVQIVRATDRNLDILDALKQFPYMSAKWYDDTLFKTFFVNK